MIVLRLDRRIVRMPLVNCCVVLGRYSKGLYPWKITAVHISTSLRGYYHNILESQIQSTSSVAAKNFRLTKGYLGKSKEALDLVDLELDVCEAVGAFGSYIKYVVDDDEKEESVPVASPTTNTAFSVLMSSQRALCLRKLPSRVLREKKTKKEMLYNDIIAVLENHGIKWKSSEVDGSGVHLVSSLTECLWYIDGHHHVFMNQACHIPEVFKLLVGYNTPEASKHRKRTIQNMSGSTISSLASSLFGCLQGGYWKRPEFTAFLPHVEQLARAMAEYSNYLVSQNKRMKACHSSETAIRQLSDSLSVQVVQSSAVSLPCFNSLSKALKRTAALSPGVLDRTLS